MSFYTCIMIDDEPKALKLLELALDQLFPNIKVIGKYTDWKDGLQAIRDTDFDILFIDISMPEKTGFEMLSLVSWVDFEVIFITAFSEFALKAFDVGASGYILKPLEEDSLIKVVDRTLNRIKGKKGHANDVNHFGLVGVHHNKGIDYIEAKDIIYFEAQKRCTKIVTTTYSSVASNNLGFYKDIAAPYDFFLQIHRSFIVNLFYVSKYINDGTVLLKNNNALPVSKNYRQIFFDRIS